MDWFEKSRKTVPKFRSEHSRAVATIFDMTFPCLNSASDIEGTWRRNRIFVAHQHEIGPGNNRKGFSMPLPPSTIRAALESNGCTANIPFTRNGQFHRTKMKAEMQKHATHKIRLRRETRKSSVRDSSGIRQVPSRLSWRKTATKLVGKLWPIRASADVRRPDNKTSQNANEG